MLTISTNDNILRIEGRETKFDTGIVSNSLVNLLESYLEARIVQQLHYWTVKEYGRVIDGLRWIYKPIREWLSEAISGFTSWQLRKAISSLVEKGILLREHLFGKHHGHNFAPKNRTYYYSLNYKGLEEFARKYEKAETLETFRFVSPTNQFCENSENQFCEKTKNRSENTSIENYSKDPSHPHLPVEYERVEESNQDKCLSSKPELSKVLERPDKKKVDFAKSSVVDRTTIPAGVEDKINEYKDTIKLTKPQIQKTPKGTKQNRKDNAPWRDGGEFKRFYRELLEYAQVFARNPQGLVQHIITKLRRGEPDACWDDFKAGLPIGSSTQPEWEVEPGVPYPMFVEYLVEKIRKGDNSQSYEQALEAAFRILDQPKMAKAFWGQFKRSVVNTAEQVERDRALGVSSPATPTWTRERIEPSLEEAAAAGERIAAVNGSMMERLEAAQLGERETVKGKPKPLPLTPSPLPLSQDPWTDRSEPQPTLRELLTKKLGDRNLKGFVKAMPQVSPAEVEAEERAEIKPKTSIAQMSVAEINDYLRDPILRKQITPGLMRSDYELITDELGQIIAVKRTPSPKE